MSESARIRRVNIASTKGSPIKRSDSTLILPGLTCANTGSREESAHKGSDFQVAMGLSPSTLVLTCGDGTRALAVREAGQPTPRIKR